MSQQLSSLDVTFLELEDGDRSAHMHIGGILVFDGPAPELEELRSHLEERLQGLPRYRQRLSRRTAGGLRRPEWKDDPDFDIDVHVTRAALPAPGGEEELLDWAGDFYSHRLDRSRPLWRSVLLEGLEDGRWALATKTHHCLVDGVGARDTATVMLDTSPSPPPWRTPEPPPAPAHGALHELASLVTLPARVGLDGARGLLELGLREELAAAPHTSLNVPLGEHRRLAVAHVELARVKVVREALGGTVNDVVLALVTAGLRRLLLARDEIPPAAGLRAMVPVNLRPPDGGAELGNQVSSLFVDLPVDEPDPDERFRRVRAEAGRRKAGHQAAGGHALIELGALAPPVLHSLVGAPDRRHPAVQRHRDERARARGASSTRSGASCARSSRSSRWPPSTPSASPSRPTRATCASASTPTATSCATSTSSSRASSRARRARGARRRLDVAAIGATIAATTNASVHATSTAAPAPGASRYSIGQAGEPVAGLAGQEAADRRRGGEQHGVDHERVGGQRDDRARLVADQRADRDAEQRAQRARGERCRARSASSVRARQRERRRRGRTGSRGRRRTARATQTTANSDAGERGRRELRGQHDAAARLEQQRRADRAVAELAR